MMGALLVGTAVWLVFSVPGRGGLVRLSAQPVPRSDRRPGMLVAVAAAVLLGALAFLGGLVVLMVGAALLAPVLTAAQVLRGRLGQRRRDHDRTEVARACTILAAQMRAGQVPTAALRSAAAECPVLADAAGMVAVGADVEQLWHRQAERPGQEGLARVARAWALSRQAGTALAPALTGVADALRSDQEVRRTIESELAAPVLTSRLLAALPLLGLGLGYSMGGNPVAFLSGSVIGAACLLLGVLLACAGVLWTERIAAKAR